MRIKEINLQGDSCFMFSCEGFLSLQKNNLGIRKESIYVLTLQQVKLFVPEAVIPRCITDLLGYLLQETLIKLLVIKKVFSSYQIL